MRLFRRTSGTTPLALALGHWLVVLTIRMSPAVPEAPQAPPALRYDAEYPFLRYGTAPLTDRVAALERRVARAEARLARSATRGYLDSLLSALDVATSSQVLVFSKTSVATGGIAAATPRAIYFNDDTYVAWVQGAGTLEIASMDPALGPVFRTLGPDGRFRRQTGQCLECHDSLSLTGGGVPRFIVGSGYTAANGTLISHEGWIVTSHRSPIRSRWGGWYVTGSAPGLPHLGNLIVNDAAALRDLNSLRRAAVPALTGLVDTTPYPAATSDIVALLVLEHQVTVQNAITRAGYDVRQALHRQASGDAAAASPNAVARLVEPLADALLFGGDAPLTAPVAGSPEFTRAFASRGPRDAQGRSLRDLELRTRVFKYPLSFLIDSPAFDALPEAAQAATYQKVQERLSQRGDTTAIEILLATKPAAAAYLRRNPDG